ncbi:MAG: hypothetical protein J6M60_07695 [Clostridia bacterium]|nr:hypothetical protein [Clostridia bacterium]
MRKILLGIILLLLIVLGINIVTKGIEPFGFKIQSMGQIEESSKTLKTKIEDANRKIDTEIDTKIKERSTAFATEQKTKSEYLEYVNKSSNEQIMAAKTLKSYAIEFLWMKLGTHAREEGVNLTFEIGTTGADSASSLNFIVDGSYIAITNFVYSIENDSELDFRIENFKLLPHNGEILEATFNVTGVKIEGNMSASSSGTTPSSTQSNNNSNNQNSAATNTVDNGQNTNTTNGTTR